MRAACFHLRSHRTLSFAFVPWTRVAPGGCGAVWHGNELPQKQTSCCVLPRMHAGRSYRGATTSIHPSWLSIVLLVTTITFDEAVRSHSPFISQSN